MEQVVLVKPPRSRDNICSTCCEVIVCACMCVCVRARSVYLLKVCLIKISAASGTQGKKKISSIVERTQVIATTGRADVALERNNSIFV